MKKEELQAIADLWGQTATDESAAPREHPKVKAGFRPQLNPIQGESFDAIRQGVALYVLLHGPRASGKSVGGVHALVDHCVENDNARGLIIVPTARQGEEGGTWEKLHTFVKTEWADGANVVISKPSLTKAKDLFCWVSNRHGGWSRIFMLSMPYDTFVGSRIKALEPTFCLLDEAQTFKSDVYFTQIVQQLGRPRTGSGAIANQPIVFCCNPAGRSHWLYRRFFELPYDPETGECNKDYYVCQVPMADNMHRIDPAYLRRLLEATKNDEIEYRRMILGEWVDRPDGDAMFAEDFRREAHVVGDATRNVGIMPSTSLPIITGWDLGSAHSVVIFQQLVVEPEQLVWRAFDELIAVDKYMAYKILVPALIKRMTYWCTLRKHLFQFQHISDNSAFNQFRAKEGSFDHLDVQQLSRRYCLPRPGYPGLPVPSWWLDGVDDLVEREAKELEYRMRFVIQMLPCPKAAYSVEHRVRSATEKLQTNAVVISATCPGLIECLEKLERDKDERMKPRRSRWLHPFDGWTYPHHYYDSGGVGLPSANKVKPRVYGLN